MPQESFLQLQSDLEDSESNESEELGKSSTAAGGSHLEKEKEPPQAGRQTKRPHEENQEATTTSKEEAGTAAEEESKSLSAEEEGSQASGEEHASRSTAGVAKGHAEGEGGSSERASHTDEDEQGQVLHESGKEDKGKTAHAKAKPHEHEEEGISEHEKAKPHEPVEEEEETAEHEKPKPHKPAHEAERTNGHEEATTKAQKHGRGPVEVSHETEFDILISRLRPLLRSAKGKELYGRLLTMIDLHEKTLEAEEELKSEAEKEKAKNEEALMEKIISSAASQEDLLLTQQLSNMWVLPFYEEAKRETCLSGFEKLAHEATITCSDPQCFKLETQAQQCHYMSIASIMRKEDFDAQTGQPKSTKMAHLQAAKDHMLLGFDGECRKPETLGSEILTMLQHPKNLAKKHTLERSTGSGGTVPLQKHHLDLICDAEEKTEYPSCKTVYEALQHVTEPKPRALPELLVLTDIKDLKNTLGLYRITFLFEGLVQFATPDGAKVDASQHKLPAEEAEFMRKHRHQDISTTVMLKPE
ncbi:hypothetical protein, conserved [Eimeria praecox]|uniref:Uncharacterized protein n=1 Tax=Eimeria praecox TaxID=51316 RepID=U6GGM9_9EIME|nr:hypothetical protein, conserved [Eimeria praecox]